MPPSGPLSFAEIARLTREGHLGEALERLKSLTAAAESILPGRDRTQSLGQAFKTFGKTAVTGAAPFRQGLRETVERLRAGAAAAGHPDGGASIPVPVPDGARFETRSFSNAAGSRSYKLYVPSSFDGQPMPLIVMLHGCTQSPDDFALGTRMNDLAEEQGFFVAYPAQPASANGSKCWNWFRTTDQQRDAGEPSLIAGITRKVMADLPVGPGQVYVAGLSAGGAAAAVMGQAYPDLYAAIGVHSGLARGIAHDVGSAFAAMKQAAGPTAPGHPVPAIVFHGDGDTTVVVANADRVLDQARPEAVLRKRVAEGTSPGGVRFTRTVEVDARDRPVLERWMLHGAGHAWSGGSPSGTYTDPRGPDASREMVRFFRQHATAARA